MLTCGVFLLVEQDPIQFLVSLFEHVSRDFMKLCDDDRLFQSTDGSYEFIVGAVFPVTRYGLISLFLFLHLIWYHSPVTAVAE